MGAVCTVYLALLEAGAHVVSTASVYGPSRGLMEKDFSRFGVESTYVDTSDLAQVEQALRPNTRLVYVETPANPTMQVSDIERISELAHAHGCLVVVDNTFASPYLQRPLELGADVVLHSVTKFINGHADVVGGVIVAKDMDLYKRLRKTMVNSGCNMDPHQAFLVLRGLKTLGIRVERAQQSAMEIARWLEQQPEVSAVRYIGLESHPQHELAKRQMSGFGSMISFELKGGMKAGRLLMDHVRVATLAVSLGGVETLIEHPASMTHASMSPEDRRAAGYQRWPGPVLGRHRGRGGPDRRSASSSQCYCRGGRRGGKGQRCLCRGRRSNGGFLTECFHRQELRSRLNRLRKKWIASRFEGAHL